MINELINTTREDESDRKQLAFLYDIGCNIEQGIIKVEFLGFFLFFNLGKPHACGCPLQVEFTFDKKLTPLNFILDRGGKIGKIMHDSSNQLTEIWENYGHTSSYLEEQWNRQRQCQQSLMENKPARELQRQVEPQEELVELEDQFREAHEEMLQHRRQSRRTQTTADIRHMQELPDILVILEEEIENIVQELGSDAFRNLPGATAAETKSLIKIKISKSKLYKAKVGVCEVQRKRDQRGSGTQMQARFEKLMNSKTKLLKNKWNSYNTKAQDYNLNYKNNVQIRVPDLDQVKVMTLQDPFWNLGSITHPNEPWATDSNVQKGIEAHLLVNHCQDELHQISREARQAVQWAVKKASTLDHMLRLLRNDDQPQNNEYREGQEFLLELCTRHDFPRSVVESVHGDLAKRHRQVWMSWNSHCSKILNWSRKYLESSDQDEADIHQKWNWVISNCQSTWEKLVAGDSIFMNFEDREEAQEEEMLEQEELGVLDAHEVNINDLIDTHE
ncbi:hypothetical protein MJO28_009363 [Puccinia striiformis f. sp. tritici]|uniref:Uncharacterized protein n=1 Tax=Puccinia striiformis f. sp. tritici TaxID=168172 RepID=A0ACC0E8I9_9BASI|nr:hypothetical protein MJO28_009363 [Puccinia striiformis f. sp. tritici]